MQVLCFSITLLLHMRNLVLAQGNVPSLTLTLRPKYFIYESNLECNLLPPNVGLDLFHKNENHTNVCLLCFMN